MWDSIWCIFLLLVLLCAFYFWPFGYVKDSVLRFVCLIVGSFMVFCIDFFIRKKIDTKFTAKSISWMICKMQIKLRVPFTFIFLNFLFQNSIIKYFLFSSSKSKWPSVLKRRQLPVFFCFLNLYFFFSVSPLLSLGLDLIFIVELLHASWISYEEIYWLIDVTWNWFT